MRLFTVLALLLLMPLGAAAQIQVGVIAESTPFVKSNAFDDRARSGSPDGPLMGGEIRLSTQLTTQFNAGIGLGYSVETSTEGSGLHLVRVPLHLTAVVHLGLFELLVTGEVGYVHGVALGYNQAMPLRGFSVAALLGLAAPVSDSLSVVVESGLRVALYNGIEESLGGAHQIDIPGGQGSVPFRAGVRMTF